MDISNFTAEQCEQKAAEAYVSERESFKRSDTDGCVSQWCSNLSGQQYARQAQIARDGGTAEFVGLYQGERRVKARLINRPAYNAPWRTVATWELHFDEERVIGRRFIPAGDRSRIQKALGLSERTERAPAVAYIGGNGNGLSGLASCFIGTQRTGDQWGQDAMVCPDEVVA